MTNWIWISHVPFGVSCFRGEGDINRVNKSVVTCLLHNHFLITPLPMQCSPFPLGKGKATVRAEDQLRHTDPKSSPERTCCFRGVYTIYNEIRMHLQSLSQTEN